MMCGFLTGSLIFSVKRVRIFDVVPPSFGSSSFLSITSETRRLPLVVLARESWSFVSTPFLPESSPTFTSLKSFSISLPKSLGLHTQVEKISLERPVGSSLSFGSSWVCRMTREEGSKLVSTFVTGGHR